MKKGQKTEDKHAESWGQIGWTLGWRHTTASSTSGEFITYSGKQEVEQQFSGGVLL
jgi:hypothetical protein